MKYDPQLTRAELTRIEILINHYLRRIKIERDAETAREFHQKLGKLESEARRCWKEVSMVK